MADNPSKGQEALAAIAGIAPGLIARFTSGGANANVPPELRQLLGQSVERQQYQNPLFQAVTNQAFQGLPTYAREGLSLNPNGMSQQAPQVDGGMPDWLKAALAGAGGAAAGDALSGGNMLKGLIDGLKKLFGNKGRNTVQGNKPYPGGAMTGPSAFDPNNFMGWPDDQQGPQLTPRVDTDFSFPDFPGMESYPFGPTDPVGLAPDLGRGGFGPGMWPPLADPSEE